MLNETPTVVAPRPVRLSTTFFTRTDDQMLAYTVPDSNTHSRAPSRSALSSEALDEFFSILIHQPRSLTFPAFLADHNFNLRTTPQRGEREQPSASARAAESPKLDSNEAQAQVDTGVRWFSSVFLSSPVSRMHTRNPFQKHNELRSPEPVTPLTPRAVPLPSPTPDELLENV
ncbi:hypothetical protein D9613_002915 [Agrocybe pediades]|uniref:Uncharacterized protein n=1 Tax=Agrocybe pediades TaxID=84607 RepID=A0A8H4QPR3_9AGAR|nr:hypothetical protein D9613_002915 [Agrocybe pediades]